MQGAYIVYYINALDLCLFISPFQNFIAESSLLQMKHTYIIMWRL